MFSHLEERTIDRSRKQIFHFPFYAKKLKIHLERKLVYDYAEHYSSNDRDSGSRAEHENLRWGGGNGGILWDYSDLFAGTIFGVFIVRLDPAQGYLYCK